MRPSPTAPQDPNRQQFHLSLRLDDDFERRLGAVVKRMPRGYGKMFFVRIARLFGREAESDDELLNLMLDFVVDCRPVRLVAMPEVAPSAHVHSAVRATAPAALEQPPQPVRQALLFADRDELGTDIR